MADKSVLSSNILHILCMCVCAIVHLLSSCLFASSANTASWLAQHSFGVGWAFAADVHLASAVLFYLRAWSLVHRIRTSIHTYMRLGWLGWLS